VTEDAVFHTAVRESLEVIEGVDVHAHAAVAPRADVVVVDAETTSAADDEGLAESGSGVTIVVAPEIDAAVRERGRRVNAAAYVRKDEGLVSIIGLVIELASRRSA
jgi:hypothetical protein